MQKQSKSQSTKLPEDASLSASKDHAAGKHLAEGTHIDGEYAAKLFTYYRGWQNPHKVRIVPLKLVSGKGVYKKHKAIFDKFASLASKNNFDANAYMEYCVIRRGMNEKNIDKALLSYSLLQAFCSHLKKKKKLDKIYAWFMNTVKMIVSECVAEQTYTTIDYLRNLIRENKIGPYVASGKISIYYLAAIPSFNKVIEHLDYFSKLELTLLAEHFEMYHSDVNEAFLAKNRTMVNPIRLTDRAILKALHKI